MANKELIIADNKESKENQRNAIVDKYIIVQSDIVGLENDEGTNSLKSQEEKQLNCDVQENKPNSPDPELNISKFSADNHFTENPDTLDRSPKDNEPVEDQPDNNGTIEEYIEGEAPSDNPKLFEGDFIDNDDDDVLLGRSIRQPGKRFRIFDESEVSEGENESYLETDENKARSVGETKDGESIENNSYDLEYHEDSNITDIEKLHHKENKSKNHKKSSKAKYLKSSEKSKHLGKEKKMKPSRSKQISTLISSESEPETAHADDLDRTGLSASVDEDQQQVSSTSKVLRKSAKKAMEEMQSIQSEQQRILREMEISVHYKPKAFTLQEFLQRKSSLPLQISAEKPPIVLKEVENYSKMMKERMEKCAELYHSDNESESEHEIELEPNNDYTSDNNQSVHDIRNTDTGEQSIQHSVEIIPETSETRKADVIEEAVNLPQKYTTIEMGENIRDTNNEEVVDNHREAKTSESTSKRSLLSTLINSDFKPVIGGDPKKLIDLETGDLIDRKPTGIETLLERAMSSIKKPQKQSTTDHRSSCNVLTMENDKLEIINVNFNTGNREESDKDIIKPRADYIALKKRLKDVMIKKRLEEIKKRSERSENMESISNSGGDEVEEKDFDDSSEDEISVEKKRAKEAGDWEIESENNNDGDEVDSDNEIHEKISHEDDDEEDEHKDALELENQNFEEEGLKDHSEIHEASNEANVLKANKNMKKDVSVDSFDFTFQNENTMDGNNFLQSIERLDQLNNKQDDDEISNADSVTSGKALLSQIPLTNGNDVDESELMALCSGMFGGEVLNDGKMGKESNDDNINYNEFLLSEHGARNSDALPSSDGEDENDELNEDQRKRMKKFKKKRHKLKRNVKLFSDEEDEEDDDQYNHDGDDKENDNENTENCEEIEEENEEAFNSDLEKYVEYDSEENEIPMTKDGKAKLARKFIEEEAELSESEWKSSDEDEAGLDNYEKQLLAEEKFDDESLQRELCLIHSRKMMDADTRAVRELKEFLIPDEEIGGVGRQRTFKWRNLENTFTLENEDNNKPDDFDQSNNENNEQNEQEWRKMRHERERFLKEQSQSIIAKEESDVNSEVNVLTKDTKICTLNDDNTLLPMHSLNSFLITRNLKDKNQTTTTNRGSFLIRDPESLHKISGLTKYPNSNNTSEMANVSISSKPKNFVFATISAEESEAKRKRRAEEEIETTANGSINYMKRPKLQPRREKCFIDQLLE